MDTWSDQQVFGDHYILLAQFLIIIISGIEKEEER
jgi:hypothetical protein